jgi:hypothetical protein
VIVRIREFMFAEDHGECTGIHMDRERQGVVSAMFWGCITYNGAEALTSIDGNMID